MNAADIQDVVKEVMGKDPIEMVVNYYKGLIQISADVIAEENKRINKLQQRIDELTTTTNQEGA